MGETRGIRFRGRNGQIPTILKTTKMRVKKNREIPLCLGGFFFPEYWDPGPGPEARCPQPQARAPGPGACARRDPRPRSRGPGPGPGAREPGPGPGTWIPRPGAPGPGSVSPVGKNPLELVAGWALIKVFVICGRGRFSAPTGGFLLCTFGEIFVFDENFDLFDEKSE